MPHRRKIPRGRRPRAELTDEDQLRLDISDIDQEERRLALELLDVFADVTTPEGTDEEDEVVENDVQSLASRLSGPSTSAAATGVATTTSEATTSSATASSGATAAAATPEAAAASSGATAAASSPSSPEWMPLLSNMLGANWNPALTSKFAELYCYPHYKSSIRRKMARMKKIARKADFGSAYQDPVYWEELERINRLYPDNGQRNFLHELIALYCYIDNKSRVESSSEADDEDDSDDEVEKKDGNDDSDDDAGVGGKRVHLDQQQAEPLQI